MSGKVKKQPTYVKSSHKTGQSFGHVADKRFKTKSSTTDSPAPKGKVRKPSEYSPMGDLHNYMGHMKKAKFHDEGHNTFFPGFQRTGLTTAQPRPGMGGGGLPNRIIDPGMGSGLGGGMGVLKGRRGGRR